jgi:polysaccharide export outer membrane protein
MAPLTLNKEAHMKTATLTIVCSLALAGPAFAQTAGTANPSPIGTSGTKPAADATTPSAASTANDYRLAAGDKLRIEVYKDDKLSQPSLQIRPDGKITLPLLGDLPAAGRTSLELREAISTGLKEYMTDPVVTVIVVETTPQVVYVTGEVNKPGALPLVNGHMSIVQAIAMAGGFTDFAKRKDVLVMRKSGKGMETLHFNYKEAVADENRREPLQLMPGDTVIVK